MNYKIINANIDLGLHIDGASKGPKLISANFKNYPSVEIDQDYITKEKDINNKTKNLKYINKFIEKLFNEISESLTDGYFPITIGGDHCLAVGSALAANTINNDIGIIWIDAHADYNTIETTITGNVHGLPLAAINAHNKNELSSFLNPKYISHERTVIVGARDIDEKEKDNLLKDNITVYTTEDIHKFGVNKIMEMAFEKAAGNNHKLHISYDLDSIDPEVLPGVSVPVKNGLTIDEAYDIMKYIKNNEDYLTSLDLVEYNPLKDIDNKSLNIATNLINILTNKKC